MVQVLGHLQRVAQADQGGVLRIVRQEYRREILIAYARPVERQTSGGATADVLDIEALDFILAAPPLARERRDGVVVDTLHGIRSWRGFVAESGGPCGIRGD